MFYVVDIYSLEVHGEFDTEEDARYSIEKYSINPLESGCIVMDKESYDAIKSSRSKWVRVVKS